MELSSNTKLSTLSDDIEKEGNLLTYIIKLLHIKVSVLDYPM